MKKLLLIILTVAGLSVLSSCGSEQDQDLIGEAQMCLDTATSATAASCLDKLEGLDSQAANVVRCAGLFLEAGFGTKEQLTQAFEALDSDSGSGSSTLGFLGLFKFSSTSAANTANEACKKSGTKGYIMISEMAVIATALSPGTGVATQADMLAALNSCSGTCLTAIGSAAISAYETSCSGDDESNEQMCTELSQAIASAGGDAATVGAQLKDLWDNP